MTPAQAPKKTEYWAPCGQTPTAPRNQMPKPGADADQQAQQGLSPDPVGDRTLAAPDEFVGVFLMVGWEKPPDETADTLCVQQHVYGDDHHQEQRGHGADEVDRISQQQRSQVDRGRLDAVDHPVDLAC